MAKKTLTALTALAISAIALTGCSAGSSSKDASSGIDGEIKGDIKVVTWRTDLVQDGTFDGYVKAFEEKYPDVKVTVEGITDYEGEMKTRLSTSNYGDVIGIPTMQQSQFEQFMEPLGKKEDFAGTYRFVNSGSYEGTQYGISVGGNANGILYNKKVFEEAGITELPVTGAEFIDDLKKVKENTDAVPYYTNYKDGWPLTQSFSNLGSITHNADASSQMAKDPAPWTAGKDVYDIDSLLFDAVSQGLTEADPLTTNWEQSKADFAAGKIATMPLGSWAISQFDAAAKTSGASTGDIGYMAYPASVDGKQYAVMAGDYNLGVSKHSKSKAAAWAWIKWFVEDSGFADSQGMISTKLDQELPKNLGDFKTAGVEMMELNPAPAGEESLLADVANDSQIDLWGAIYRQKLIDIARGAADGDKASYFEELNKRWAAAVEKNTK